LIAQMSGDVIGRAAELAAIEQLLDAVLAGPAAMVLEGDPGIGKTTLLRAAHVAAERRKIRVLGCEARAPETRLAYDALGDLLSGVEAADVAALPRPQCDALSGALLCKPDSAGDDTDPRAVATAVLTLIERLAQKRPLLLAIDDMQWIDEPSAQVLAFCARRLKGRVGLIVTRRSSAERVLPERELRLRDPDRLEIRCLAPLDGRYLRRLVRQRALRPLPRGTLERIHEVSGGNPLYALELARVLPGDGPPPPALPLSLSLQEMVEARLADLGEPLEETLLAVAAMARPTVDLVVQVLGPQSEALLDDAEDRGLIERDGRRLRFTHQLLANAIHTRASAECWRDMHRRLSSVVPDIEERARHLAHAQMAPDAVPALDEAARYVRGRGAPAAAAELLELALGLGGGSELRVRAAEHHLDAGDAARAQTLLTEAIPALKSGEERAHALLLLAEIRYHDDSYPEARALLEEAQSERDLGPRMRVMIELRLAFVLCNLGLVVEAEAPARGALAGADALGDDALRAQALALEATVDFALARGISEARLARALTLEIADVRTSSVLRPSLVGALLHLWTGRLDESRLLLGGLCDRHAERGEEHELGWACYALVWLECWSGNLPSATRAMDEAFEQLEQLRTRNGRALALAARAQVAAWGGREEDARRNAEEALTLFHWSGWTTASWRPRATLGFLELSLGDYEAAAHRLGPAALAAVSTGLAAPVTWGGELSYGDTVEALVGVGRLDEAELIVPLLERRGSAPGGAWPRGLAARCRGLMLAARGDLSAAEEMLEHAVAAHRHLPVPMERARGLLLLGRVQHRRRKRLAARDTLEQALATFEDIGAALWAERTREEIDSIELPSKGPDGLTATEELIARLAASGRTNREVAASMHVSPKTVELHLGRAYRKLGIRSRAELGAHMALRSETGLSRIVA
jgi:ATP/maltotriose-dependent transcriptional regulator MalT